MKRKKAKRQRKIGMVLVLLILFLLWGKRGRWDGSILLQQGEVLIQWMMGLEESRKEPSLEVLLWEEQRQALMMGMRVENQTPVMPEDMVEWQQSMTEWDEDLLAQIDRENEALRQQTESLQQNQMTGSPDLLEEPVVSDRLVLSLPYTREQLGSLTFLKENIYNVNRGTKVTEALLDAKQLLSMDMTLEQPDSGGPKILIHHTHATEYFSDSNEKQEATLIVGVGDYLEELLEQRYGVEVIHDRTVYPYNEAYSQALKHVEQILADNPTIEVFIDLHRDAGGTKSYTVNLDGKKTAHLMFFNGLSHTQDGPISYLPNVNQQANLAFSLQMKLAGDSLYPGLCKRNYLKAYRYNLHVLPRSVIVEVGDNNNTLQEAKNAMEPLAEILWYVLTEGTWR